MTLREKINELQKEIEVLRKENESLKQQQQPMKEEIDSLRKEFDKAAHDAKFYRARLEDVITRKSILEKKYKSLRKQKIKLVYINFDDDKNIISDFSEALDTIKSLRFEVSALYESNDALEIENKKLKADLKDLDQVADLYHVENDQLKAELDEIKSNNRQLRSKILSQNVMLNSCKDKTTSTPVLIQGIERDIYPGEQTDIILEILSDRIKNLDSFTRQYCVLKSILDANPEVGERTKIKQKLKNIFRSFTGYKNLTNAQNADLNELGFTYVPCNSGHSKLMFKNDDRFVVTMAGTPSDQSRSLNQVNDISRILL